MAPWLQDFAVFVAMVAAIGWLLARWLDRRRAACGTCMAGPGALALVRERDHARAPAAGRRLPVIR